MLQDEIRFVLSFASEHQFHPFWLQPIAVTLSVLKATWMKKPWEQMSSYGRGTTLFFLSIEQVILSLFQNYTFKELSVAHLSSAAVHCPNTLNRLGNSPERNTYSLVLFPTVPFSHGNASSLYSSTLLRFKCPSRLSAEKMKVGLPGACWRKSTEVSERDTWTLNVHV